MLHNRENNPYSKPKNFQELHWAHQFISGLQRYTCLDYDKCIRALSSVFMQVIDAKSPMFVLADKKKVNFESVFDDNRGELLEFLKVQIHYYGEHYFPVYTKDLFGEAVEQIAGVKWTDAPVITTAEDHSVENSYFSSRYNYAQYDFSLFVTHYYRFICKDYEDEIVKCINGKTENVMLMQMFATLLNNKEYISEALELAAGYFSRKPDKIKTNLSVFNSYNKHPSMYQVSDADYFEQQFNTKFKEIVG